MSESKNLEDVFKAIKSKYYSLILRDLKTKELKEIMALGILIKTTNLKSNMYVDSFDYIGRFLTQVYFDIKNTNQTLMDGDNRYSLELEYDLAENGSNKIINNMKHRSFLLKIIRV